MIFFMIAYSNVRVGTAVLKFTLCCSTNRKNKNTSLWRIMSLKTVMMTLNEAFTVETLD